MWWERQRKGTLASSRNGFEAETFALGEGCSGTYTALLKKLLFTVLFIYYLHKQQSCLLEAGTSPCSLGPDRKMQKSWMFSGKSQTCLLSRSSTKNSVRHRSARTRCMSHASTMHNAQCPMQDDAKRDSDVTTCVQLKSDDLCDLYVHMLDRWGK